VPTPEISKKEIIYSSEVYFTPLNDSGIISADGIKEIIDREYKKAGIVSEEIKSGAVIITGESAEKRNARAVIEAISEYSGAFIAQEAGADTESILSAKGAGAQKASSDEMKTVASVNIGGGTTNCAVFKDGKLCALSCCNIGGRLVKVKDSGGKAVVACISPYLRNFIDDENIIPENGERLTVKNAEKIAQSLAYKLISELEKLPDSDLYIFSGGVAECMKEKSADLYKYGDIGCILAEKIIKSQWYKSHNCTIASNALRATVIGAGNYSFEVSGSTVSIFNCPLPIKNIPCVKVSLENEKEISGLFDEIKTNERYFSQTGVQAVAFDGWRGMNAQNLEDIAREIKKSFADIIRLHKPLIVLIREDTAKALGVYLRSILENDYPILCIDGIEIRESSYIDIGTYFGHSTAVSVCIKQLIFAV
jgi:ethanolamine utilization protein EutA